VPGLLRNLFTPLRGWRGKLLLAIAALALAGFASYLAWVNIQAWRSLRAGREAEGRGDYPRAGDCFRQCLVYWPRSGEAHFLLARTLRRLRQFDEARDQLSAAEQLNWSPRDIDVERTMTRARQGDFLEVEKTLQEWGGGDDPNAVAAAEVLAASYLVNNLTGQALHWAKRFQELAPENGQALVLRARAHEQRSDSAGALNYFRRAVEVLPDDRPAREGLADLLLRALEPREALHHYQWLRERYPDAKGVLLGLARCYRSLGEREQCRQLLDRLLAEHPADAAFTSQVLTERAVLAWKERRLTQAERLLKKALRFAPTKQDTLYTLFRCLRDQGHRKRAEAERYRAKWKKVVEDTNRLNVLVHMGLVREPRNPAVPFEIGAICLKYGLGGLGVYWLKRALRLDPDYSPARQALADYYQTVQDEDLGAKSRRPGEEEKGLKNRGTAPSGWALPTK
jgi:tetratricopeptide (TPR) repeat protein